MKRKLCSEIKSTTSYQPDLDCRSVLTVQKYRGHIEVNFPLSVYNMQSKSL